MNSKNLKEKTIKGFKWNLFDNVGRSGGQFAIGVILTRLLSPSDFGLVGMLTIFIVVGNSLTNSGFGQALIQKKEATKVDFSTVFYFNVFAGTIIYLIFYFSSPLIAKFYREPQLILLTKIICLIILIDALGAIHKTYLEKNLNFKVPSIVGVLSVFISGVIGIFMAYNNFGVWSLVLYTVSRSSIATMLLWWLSKWRPLFVFKIKSLKGLFAYGSKILVAGLINSIFQNIYFLIIGRFFNAETLGYYTRANQFSDLPTRTITSVVQRVTFPVFSIIQNDHQQLISGYTKAIRLLTASVLPLMALIYITCAPLIKIVFGDQWLPVAPYLKIMCLYVWINVIIIINNQIIAVKGRSDYYLQVQVIGKILIVISIFLTFKNGIIAMIYGHMVATILTYFISNYYLNKVIPIRIQHQFKHMSPFIVSAAFMVGSSLPLVNIVKNEILYLLFSASLSIFIYILFLRIMNINELYMGYEKINAFLRSISIRLKRNND